MADPARAGGAVARSAVTPLARLIAEEVAARGPMTVARYMELALAHPEHGYYAARDPLGRTGDFVTAPEVSQMFGELIGLWAAVVWEELGKPDPVMLTELGPGRGTLMADALRAARRQPGFVEAAEVHLVETGRALRDRQARTLAAHAPRWHERLEEVPSGPLIVLANEFFDALPVRQFVRTAGGWAERLVTSGPDGGFAFVLSEPFAPDTVPPDAPTGAPEGAVWEYQPAADAVVREIAARIGRHGGAALIVDYGHAGGLGDTFQAVRAHDYADPLRDPGEADLTTHVDFAALARAAHRGGAAAFGPAGQGAFLQALGIATRAAQLAAAKDARTRESVRAALERLIAPVEMGTLFKVLALVPEGAAPPPGFAPDPS